MTVTVTVTVTATGNWAIGGPAPLVWWTCWPLTGGPGLLACRLGLAAHWSWDIDWASVQSLSATVAGREDWVAGWGWLT